MLQALLAQSPGGSAQSSPRCNSASASPWMGPIHPNAGAARETPASAGTDDTAPSLQARPSHASSGSALPAAWSGPAQPLTDLETPPAAPTSAAGQGTAPHHQAQLAVTPNSPAAPSTTLASAVVGSTGTPQDAADHQSLGDLTPESAGSVSLLLASPRQHQPSTPSLEEAASRVASLEDQRFPNEPRSSSLPPGSSLAGAAAPAGTTSVVHAPSHGSATSGMGMADMQRAPPADTRRGSESTGSFNAATGLGGVPEDSVHNPETVHLTAGPPRRNTRASMGSNVSFAPIPESAHHYTQASGHRSSLTSWGTGPSDYESFTMGEKEELRRPLGETF